MAAKLPLSSFSSCLICRSSFQPTTLTSRTQVAYKWAKKNQNRKNSKLDFVTAELFEDIPRYGPRGSIVHVTRGQMRNTFYPRRQARYIIGKELAILKQQGLTFERDRTFGVAVAPELEEKSEQVVLQAVVDETQQRLEEALVQNQEEEKRAKEVSLHAIARLPQVIKPLYSIYRKANVRAADGASSEPHKVGTPIFGSVSALDVAQEIRKSLAEDESTATIPIDESSIIFPSLITEPEANSSTSTTQRRLKELGVFPVEIHIPGSDAVKTLVEIRPDEAKEEEESSGKLLFRKIRGQYDSRSERQQRRAAPPSAES